MGNTSKKLASQCGLLTKEEQKYVGNTFKAASKNSGRIREDDLIVSGLLDAVLLEKHWGPLIDPRLAQYLSNYLFDMGSQKAVTCDFTRFAELYVYNVRGSVDQRMMVTYRSLGNYSENDELPYQLIKEYCEAIASTYIKVLKTSGGKRAEKWIDKGFRGKAAAVQTLGEAVASGVGSDPDSPPQAVTSKQLSNWLMTDTLLKHMTEMVYTTLYGLERDHTIEDGAPVTAVPPLLPMVYGLDSMPDYPAFIDLSHIVWLNNSIPPPLQHKWRFLFSSHIHGESFATMVGRICDQGASIIIVEDNHGHIFGGFATDSWEMGPNFVGREDSFLFTLAPKMRIYGSSGFNNHYQYLNQHTKTLPNGLLMGGQFNFGAIWIPADPFGEGSSAESCTTYRGYKRLSKEKDFRIRSIEVWAVGDKPESDKESGERDASILDTNPEAKAILEMAGKTRHSDGVREPPPL
ncbi:MTOR-associated protein MEAK7 isoform X1 [Leguminivora glycinivorella]|uniref:MTOR-associated protein MEAK7 isoform X1 n=1 Tax=Leguminivora glycinivorella TaxID=1035111 RepID=UPI00200F948B|nr:MTOR-associated protein MEAK7 isoform X1 [Leguminivora glycinivorella]XP_048001120.1 MTOR-associated protein MEAK7 isoform X1 [Leguminivora glycinivorella]XP_048001121.1 MTOR-associated protein MEAK7 isoform X1 [Leguminivora glycinivorella]